MIEFSENQESKALRHDCRAWTELVGQSWYTSENPLAADYPVEELIHHLRAVYFACSEAGIENMEYVTLLGFNVLRANASGCSAESVEAMVDYFLLHAQGDNVEYAQNWIDLYLDTDE